MITRYLMKVTNDSLVQVKRLMQQYVKTKAQLARQNGFKRTYTDTDIRFLVSITPLNFRHSTVIRFIGTSTLTAATQPISKAGCYIQEAECIRLRNDRQ